MKTKVRDLLTRCIEAGIEGGWRKAHKHTSTPEEQHVFDMIDHYIWLEIDEVFSFDDEGDNA